MQGVVNINGFIGSFPGPDGTEIKGVELIDVIAQVQMQKLAQSFLVKINSKGGSCKVGHEIYMYLKTLGLPVYTEATGFCCSMGSIIMMAGETREAVEPLEFLAHNPWTEGVGGDYDEISAAAEEMRAEEDKMIDVYSKATGLTKEGVDAIMKQNKPIELQKAVDLGFLTAIKKKKRTLAFYKTNKKMAEEITMLEKFKKQVDRITKALKISEPKAMKATTTDGKEVEFMNSAGEDFAGDPIPGDQIMIGGAPAPDGQYLFDAYTVDVLLGVVTTVTPSIAAAAKAVKEAEEKAELERIAALTKDADPVLKAENEALKKELNDLKGLATIMGAKLEDAEKVLSSLKSSGKIPNQETGFTARGVKSDEMDLKKEAEEARKRYKK